MSDTPHSHSAQKPKATEKRCVRCELNKPLGDFLEAPNYPAGQHRKDICILCAAKAYCGGGAGAGARLSHEASLIEKDRNAITAEIEKLVMKQRSSLPHICEMGEAIYSMAEKRYGVDGNLHVAMEFWKAFDACQDVAVGGKPGGVAHQRFFELLFKIVRLGTEHKASKPVNEYFSEEEVRERLLELIEPALTDEWLGNVIKKRPALRVYTGEAS